MSTKCCVALSFDRHGSAALEEADMTVSQDRSMLEIDKKTDFKKAR